MKDEPKKKTPAATYEQARQLAQLLRRLSDDEKQKLYQKAKALKEDQVAKTGKVSTPSPKETQKNEQLD